MTNLLIKLMVLAALIDLGFTIKDISKCKSRACNARIESASLDITCIDWIPISVWPEVAKRFR